MQNITALVEMLESLGFVNIGRQLIKRISLRPSAFEIRQKKNIDKDTVTFQLFFEKDGDLDSYSITYYDAMLQKETALLGDIKNNVVDSSELQQKMEKIDWKDAFAFDSDKGSDISDKAFLQQQEQVEVVVTDLLVLEKSDEGKQIAAALKYKYWNGLDVPDVANILQPMKNKAAITQRFYCSNNTSGISVDEAIRFLNNKWLEKHLLSQKKQATNGKAAGEKTGQSNKLNAKKKTIKHK